jgi:hypothetical protein
LTLISTVRPVEKALSAGAEGSHVRYSEASREASADVALVLSDTLFTACTESL